MANLDYNKLAHEFLQVVMAHDGQAETRIRAIFDSLTNERDREVFDAAVGQIIKAEETIGIEDVQELGQEAFAYLREHRDVCGYYVPGILLISLSGAELNTTLGLWESGDKDDES
jgi:hypothetical protein